MSDQLTDEQIDAAWAFSTGGSFVSEDMRAFARKVAEEAVRMEREAIAAEWELAHGFDKHGVAASIRSRSKG